VRSNAALREDLRAAPTFLLLRVSMFMSWIGSAACTLTESLRFLGGAYQRRCQYAGGCGEELPFLRPPLMASRDTRLPSHTVIACVE
jgi:hypothetical protein